MGNKCCNCLQLEEIDKFEKEIYITKNIVPSAKDVADDLNLTELVSLNNSTS